MDNDQQFKDEQQAAIIAFNNRLDRIGSLSKYERRAIADALRLYTQETVAATTRHIRNRLIEAEIA